MIKTLLARLFLLPVLALLSSKAAPAQGLQVKVRPRGKEKEVVALLTPAQLLTLGKKAGVESDLTTTSRALTDKELAGDEPVVLGPLKAGVHVVTLRGEKASYTEVLLLEVPKDKDALATVLAASTPKVDPKTAGSWQKYWAAMNGDVLKATANRSLKPVGTMVALKAPVLLIACGAAVELPPLVIVCKSQVQDAVVDVAAEVVKQSINELEERNQLTKAEADALRAQIAGAKALAAVVLGEDMYARLVAAGFGVAEVGMELAANEKIQFAGAVAKEQFTKYTVLIKVVKAGR